MAARPAPAATGGSAAALLIQILATLPIEAGYWLKRPASQSGRLGPLQRLLSGQLSAHLRLEGLDLPAQGLPAGRQREGPWPVVRFHRIHLQAQQVIVEQLPGHRRQTILNGCRGRLLLPVHARTQRRQRERMRLVPGAEAGGNGEIVGVAGVPPAPQRGRDAVLVGEGVHPTQHPDEFAQHRQENRYQFRLLKARMSDKRCGINERESHLQRSK